MRRLTIAETNEKLKRMKMLSQRKRQQAAPGSWANPHVVGVDYRVRFKYDGEGDKATFFEVELQPGGVLSVRINGHHTDQMTVMANTCTHPDDSATLERRGRPSQGIHRRGGKRVFPTRSWRPRRKIKEF